MCIFGCCPLQRPYISPYGILRLWGDDLRFHLKGIKLGLPIRINAKVKAPVISVFIFINFVDKRIARWLGFFSAIAYKIYE